MDLEQKINGTGPIVRLIEAAENPYLLSVASARTCYSSSGIVTPEGAARRPDLLDRISNSTLKAGHLTTRQHARFVFSIENVSRHLVWSFLHSHPFYNSEQVSQRYVAVRADQFYYPRSLFKNENANALRLYDETLRLGMEGYQALTEELKGTVREEYYRIFPARAKRPEKYEREIHKKAMEAARYLLPVGALTYLYHTIDGLTLHRYRRLCAGYDVPDETRSLVEAMHAAVREKDPRFADEVEDPLPIEETPEYAFFRNFYEQEGFSLHDPLRSDRFVREFDETIGNVRSRLVSSQTQDPSILAAAVRSVLGLSSGELSDESAIDLILNPASNPRIASVLNETTLSKLMRTMVHVRYTFQKRISHTADSQDQRHRTVPGSRPILMRHFTGRPDFITPELILHNRVALEIYERAMERIFRNTVDLLDAGFEEEAVYLLPNAFPIRFYESGDLLNLHHKWKTRLCYTAQEEIFYASLDEVRQVGAIHPQIAKHIFAPCTIRAGAGITPPCPEGDRFCGVKVWRLPIAQYGRLL